MPSVEQTFRTYQELATLYAEEGQAQLRDRFLVLAADALYSAGRVEDAERVRTRLLQVNPHHLIKPFASYDQAMSSTDVKDYVVGLRRTYPPEKAAGLLEQIRAGGDMAAPEPTPRKENFDTIRPDRKPGDRPAGDAPVFRFQDDIDPEASLPRTRPEPLSRPPQRDISRGAPAQSPARPSIASPARPARPDRPERPMNAGGTPPRWQPPESAPVWDRGFMDGEPGEAFAGAWVAACLFWLLLLGGLALTGWTLAGPFLPKMP